MSLEPKHVFVSYSHRDTKFVKRIVESLPTELPNCRVEIHSDFAIGPGMQWHSEIESGLKQADVAVLMLARAAR